MKTFGIYQFEKKEENICLPDRNSVRKVILLLEATIRGMCLKLTITSEDKKMIANAEDLL